jgi:hypothetical protein
MMNEQELLCELRSIADEQREGDVLYALLDSAIYAGATMDPTGKQYGDLAAALADAKPESLFVYAYDDERTDASPLLISIGDLDSQLAARIAALAIEYRLASWIWSPLSPNALARHLAAFIRARFGDATAMLRPYDPRIMEDTLACFEPARQAALWEPIGAWAYFDEDAMVKRLQRPKEQPASNVAMPLVLDSGEQLRFEELANRIALGNYIEMHSPEIVEARSPAQRKAFYARQIEIGERLKVYSMGELFIVAALSGAYGERWVDEKDIEPMIESVVSGAAQLKSVAIEISERLNRQQQG